MMMNGTIGHTLAEDLSITRIAGLTWDQWNARLAMPLITQLREGSHPLLFPTDLSVSTVDKESKSSTVTNPDPQSPQDNQPAYSCSDCGRMYKLKSSLRNHQKWECGKEPQFSCPFCVYKAKQKMHIGRHMERMHKEKFIKMEDDQMLSTLSMKEDGNGINLNVNMNTTI
ncbi:longitudinals lacking protein, isoforms A/B/D/L-like [Bradysia coprophila]|uniref:longitudinals lacking protein, isoforms A/B/D/L-like n=1 Tax=Bradysia coprophila TaxID=38358 RepID=UPI00187DCDFC|nr:longitudinals lacking protein, isoforms A/B/D/L-like [Bradysia coprophila]